MTHAQEKNNKRKVVLIIAAILVAIGIITGGISAFFSDFVTGNSTITAGTETDLAQDATNVTWDGTAKSLTWVDPTPEIINGNSAKADFETETGGADTRTLTYTIYFKKSGKNEWQDKTVALSYAAQAIQYRNNTTADWTDLTTTEVNP